MRTIERGPMFETNSSSSHSIVLHLGRGELDRTDLLPVEDGVVRVYPGEFGWGPDSSSRSTTKASYAMTLAKEFEERDPGKAKRYLEMIEQAIRGVMRGLVKEVRWEKSGDGTFPWGYVDHQSVERMERVLFESVERLEDFIFDPKTVLLIDHD